MVLYARPINFNSFAIAEHFIVDQPNWIGGWRENGVWEWRGRYTGTISYNFTDSRDIYSNANCIILWGMGWGFGDQHCSYKTNHVGHLCEDNSQTINVMLN